MTDKEMAVYKGGLHVPRKHGNKVYPRRSQAEIHPERSVRKVPADSVPYGESISRNGRTVWAAYHNDVFVCAAATADEARGKYRIWIANRPAPDAG